MTRDIRPLQSGDLDELSRFLTSGFHTEADADFAAPEVLAWKYLDDQGEPENSRPRSHLACDEQGTIIGHVGVCRTAFQGPQLADGPVTTLHMIDWLGSPGHPSIGASLMRRAHEGADTQFGLGGSDAGRTVIKRGGYEPREAVAVYQRVVRPAQWLRTPGLSPFQRAMRLARDLGQESWTALGSGRRRPAIQPRPVSRFADEVGPIARDASSRMILTERTAARLNHLLRFPRQSMSGWHLVEPPDRLVGFALLNLIPIHQGRVRLGKIVDCLLTTDEPRLWGEAVRVLTGVLARQGADVIQTFASTAWIAEGLRDAGYRSRFQLEFSLRDRRRRIPPGTPLHLMPIEADYAYT